MLTNVKIEKTKPAKKPFKLADSQGLFLLVNPNGSKLWRYKYRIAKREKVLAIGPYPDVSLLEAREAREQAKRDQRAGTDPSQAKRLRRAALSDTEATLEAVTREWHKTVRDQWSEGHAANVLEIFERDVFPSIGKFTLPQITVPLVLQTVKAIEGRPAIDTAHRVRQWLSKVFLYGIATGRCAADPAGTIKGALRPVPKGKRPAATTIDEARAVLQAGETTPAKALTRLALRLLAITAVRPGEIRGAEWTEFGNLDQVDPLWCIPAARMKMKREHLVPLPRQAIDVLKACKQLSGNRTLVFPSDRNWAKPMSENALGYLLNRAGYHGRHVPHGWRASFSTIMNERRSADRYIIDLMLAHVSEDNVEAAYNRALHLDRRREIAQEWADLLLAKSGPAAALLANTLDR